MATDDSPSGLWPSAGTRFGLTALAGSNPASSASSPRRDRTRCCLESVWTAFRLTWAYRHEEAYGAQGRHTVALVVFVRCWRPLFLLRAAPLVRADGRHAARTGDGGPDRVGRAHRTGRAARGVYPAAHPQAGAGHPATGAVYAGVVDRGPRAGERADHRHRDQRDLAQPGRRRAV